MALGKVECSSGYAHTILKLPWGKKGIGVGTSTAYDYGYLLKLKTEKHRWLDTHNVRGEKSWPWMPASWRDGSQISRTYESTGTRMWMPAATGNQNAEIGDLICQGFTWYASFVNSTWPMLQPIMWHKSGKQLRLTNRLSPKPVNNIRDFLSLLSVTKTSKQHTGFSITTICAVNNLRSINWRV